MATIPALTAWAAAKKILASKLNAIHDAIAFLLDPPAARPFTTTVVSLTSGTATLVALPGESWDNDTMHDLVTNNSRVVATTGGRYHFAALLRVNAPSSGNIVALQLNVRKNSAGSSSGGSSILSWTGPAAGTTQPLAVEYVDTVALAAGEYLEMFVTQTHSTGLAVNLSIASLDMRWVAP